MQHGGLLITFFFLLMSSNGLLVKGRLCIGVCLLTVHKLKPHKKSPYDWVYNYRALFVFASKHAFHSFGPQVSSEPAS